MASTLLLLGASAASGCGDLEPCAGVAVGQTYEIEVIGVHEGYLPEERCHEDWGMPPGTTFTATVVRLNGDEGCLAGIPEIEGIDGWTWELNSDAWSRGVGRLLEGQYSGGHDSCQASFWLDLTVNDSQSCDPTSDDGDSCGLMVQFAPEVDQLETCPARCGLELDVRVTRL